MYCVDRGVGHICMSLCDHMRGPDMDVELMVPSVERGEGRDFMREAIPGTLRSVACRRPLRNARQGWAERRFLQRLRPDDIAYVWPGTSLSVYEQVKARGNTLVMERVNCSRVAARRVLDDAYNRLGWPAAHGITREATDDEKQKLELADYVFCPSPLVRESMLEAGADLDKLLTVTYGWDPQRMGGSVRRLEPIDGTTVLFVGMACVRKGVHLLLRAWERARIKGRLVIMGAVAPDIAEGCTDQLNRPDVITLSHAPDVAAVYRSADIFAFPTLEEAGPLVSYEAMAAGLPLLTTPMGAGEFARDGREGIILDAYDDEAWVDALRRLAADSELRECLGQNGLLRAQAYTWNRAGRRRTRSLLTAMHDSKSGRGAAVATEALS